MRAIIVLIVLGVALTHASLSTSSLHDALKFTSKWVKKEFSHVHRNALEMARSRTRAFEVQQGPSPQGSLPACFDQALATKYMAWVMTAIFGGENPIAAICGLFKNLTQSEIACLTSSEPTFQIAQDHICITVDGQDCSKVLSNVSMCDTDNQLFATECPPGCVNKGGRDVLSCQPIMTTEMLDIWCGQCVARIMTAQQQMMAQQMQKNKEAGSSATAEDIAEYQDYVQTLQNFQFGRGAFCIKSGSEYCTVTAGLLPVINENASLGLNDTAQKVFATIPLSIVNAVCPQGPQYLLGNAICYRKVLVRMLAYEKFKSISDYRKCMRNAQSTTTRTRCETRKQMSGLDAWRMGYLASATCTKRQSDSKYCMTLPSDAAGRISNFASCASSLYLNYCSSSCNSMFKIEVPQWGCCARTVMIGSYFSSCYDYSTVVAALPPRCVLPRSLVNFTKKVRLVVKWAILKYNETLKQLLNESLIADIAANTGVAPDNVMNGRFCEDGTDCPITAPQMRSMETLAGSDSLADYKFELSGTTDEEAEAASASFDSQASSGIDLPSAALTLQDEGLAAPGDPASVPVDGGSSSNNNIPIIAGAAAGGVLLIVIIAVCAMRGGGRRAPQPGDYQQMGPVRGV